MVSPELEAMAKAICEVNLKHMGLSGAIGGLGGWRWEAWLPEARAALCAVRPDDHEGGEMRDLLGRLNALQHDIERYDMFGGARSAEAAADIRQIISHWSDQ